MAWIRMLAKSDAVGKLAELFRRIAPREDERVDHILAVHSLHPDALEAHLALYRVVMYGASPLSRREREMVAVAVSATNGCHY